MIKRIKEFMNKRIADYDKLNAKYKKLIKKQDKNILEIVELKKKNKSLKQRISKMKEGNEINEEKN